MRAKIAAEVIIVGGGIAGLSAAINLGRARRDVLVLDSGHSMARWEPAVENYLGFPHGIDGEGLLERGRTQARRHKARFRRDRIRSVRPKGDKFLLKGENDVYVCSRLLLATGIFHIPPDIPGVRPCLGHSMFFCKDCDGYRVRGKPIAIYGWTNEAVEYALAMLFYSRRVMIVTDGRKPKWSKRHARWVREYKLPVHTCPIRSVRHSRGHLERLLMQDKTELLIEALFTTRGDIF